MAALPPTTSGREFTLTAGLRGQIEYLAEFEQGTFSWPVLDGWIAGPSGNGAAAFRNAWLADRTLAVDQCRGDFALVWPDSREQAVWLARSPLSSRPLFYRCDSGGVQFSSLAQDLAVRNLALDRAAIVKWYGALVGSSVPPMFCDIEKVEPGTIVRLDPNGRSVRRFWDPRRIAVRRYAAIDDVARLLRQVMEAAVADAIAQGREIGSLLSSGRDSSCVSAIAARQLREAGRTLHCYTASPGSGPPFDASEYLIDEAPGAREIAALYPNIRHQVVTPRGVRFCQEAEAFAHVHSAPLGNPVSLHWWLGIQRQAAEDGCDTLLTGGMGNLTISDGGPQYLPDLLNGGHVLQWLHAAREVASFEGASWRNIANLSVGGLLPQPLYRLAQYLHARRLPSSVAPYLGRELRAALEQEHERQDQRPPRRSKHRGAELLGRMELGDVAPDRMFGLTMLDPTADRRVVEAALSIPPEMLVSRYDRRPIFELAFGDLLPPFVVKAKMRAYQSMDWTFAYNLDELHAGLERYRRHMAIAEMLDIPAMEQGLARWPIGRLASLEETADLGEGLLRAFALGAFLWVHLPD